MAAQFRLELRGYLSGRLFAGPINTANLVDSTRSHSLNSPVRIINLSYVAMAAGNLPQVEAE
jgi:hypothetical protein